MFLSPSFLQMHGRCGLPRSLRRHDLATSICWPKNKEIRYLYVNRLPPLPVDFYFG